MMIRRKLFLCLFGISVCFISSIVAREAIINGLVVPFGQFPYLVSIQHEGQHICVGSIIRSNAILTVAHCFLDMDNQFDNLTYTVVAGTHDLQANGVRIGVAKIYVPMSFYSRERSSDIAILKLKSDLTLSGDITLRQVRRPRRRMEHAGSIAQVVGWGWTWIKQVNDREIGGFNHTNLLYADATILSHVECLLFGAHGIDLDKQFCARVNQNRGPAGVCMFDNGSPLIRDGFVVGILSRIPPGCIESHKPGTYTYILRQRVFIENALHDVVTVRMRAFTYA